MVVPEIGALLYCIVLYRGARWMRLYWLNLLSMPGGCAELCVCVRANISAGWFQYWFSKVVARNLTDQ